MNRAENENSSPSAQNRMRRLPRFSLRSLLVLLLVLFAVWLGFQVNDALKRKAALDTIRKLGGHVQYAHQFSNGQWGVRPIKPAEPPGPQWLRKMIGDDYFVTVVGVQFWEKAIADDDLVHIGVLTELQYLSFVGGQHGQINGEGLSELRSLEKLRYLDLLAHPVSDGGLSHLSELSQLESIDLRNTKITDAGLEQLSRLKNLSHIALDNTEVSDAGLEHLITLPKLESITLRNTKVTDKGVARVSTSLPRCKIVR